MNNEEIKLCKESGRKLYSELKEKGINLCGYGVGVLKDDKHQISIRLFCESDLKLVPKIYEGYIVDAIVVGEIWM